MLNANKIGLTIFEKQLERLMWKIFTKLLQISAKDNLVLLNLQNT